MEKSTQFTKNKKFMSLYVPIIQPKPADLKSLKIAKEWNEKVGELVLPLFQITEDLTEGNFKNLPKYFFYDALGDVAVANDFSEKAKKAGLHAVEVFESIGSVREGDNEICIRLRVNDDFEQSVEDLKRYEGSTEKISLVVDFASLDNFPIKSFVDYVLSRLVDLSQKHWKHLIVAGSSVPKMQAVSTKYKPCYFDRKEFSMLYQAAQKSWGRKVIYGDYGIHHPESVASGAVEFDARFMQPVAKIRYTLPEKYLIVKGDTLSRDGSKNYHMLCEQVFASGEFCGKEFSHGDEFINDCYEKKGGKGGGNATTWITTDFTHHIALVLSQVSNSS